ncbi:MAG TPA: lysozyme [Rhodoblastus sp.]|nr:lysozyme [Rhodoblastus sp.]
MILPRSMSAACRRKITEPSEGRRLVAYRDCVGVWTIGYGHTSRAGAPRVTPGMKIAEAEADEILSRDLGLFERGVAEALRKAKGEVLQREFDALVDLAFNIGLGAFRSSSLLRAYLAGDKALAAEKFLDWTKAGGRVVPGLVARRKRDRAWFLTGRLPGERLAESAAADAPARFLDPPDAMRARAVNLVQLQGADIMKGYRTILVGLALAIGPGALQYLGAVDWSALLGPSAAFFVSGALAILMRCVTTTPVGKPDQAEAPK